MGTFHQKSGCCTSGAIKRCHGGATNNNRITIHLSFLHKTDRWQRLRFWAPHVVPPKNIFKDALKVTYLVYIYSNIFVSYRIHSYSHIDESMSPSTFIQRKSKGTLSIYIYNIYTNIVSHGCHIKNFHFCARQAHHPAQGFGRSILNASSGWLFPYPESGWWWEVDHVWENSQEVLGASFYLACACILKILQELIV